MEPGIMCAAECQGQAGYEGTEMVQHNEQEYDIA